MLNYKYTQASIAVPMKAGAALTAESYLSWTSQAPNEKTLKLVLKVRGTLEDRGTKWSEEWVFDWPDDDLKKLEAGFGAISDYVNKRILRSEKRKEVFVDVYDWLRVGWVDENKAWFGYVHISRGEKVMKTEFEDVMALFQLREALRQAKV